MTDSLQNFDSSPLILSLEVAGPSCRWPGGTVLWGRVTTLGKQLIERYDALETSLNASAGKELRSLRALAN